MCILTLTMEIFELKKVLMITSTFPPVAGSGVIRILKFVKYLPQHDWQVVVLTLRDKYSLKKDVTQIKEIPDGVRVYRTVMLNPLRIGWENKTHDKKGQKGIKDNSLLSLKTKKMSLFFKQLKKKIFELFSTPDKGIGWLIPGVLRGLTLMRNEPVDIIYATSPAKTSLLIGLCLKKLTGKSYVVDFRDPWTLTGGSENLNKSKILVKVENWLELQVMKNADRIIANTNYLKNAYINKYKKIVSEKITVITNGYDVQDFAGLSRARGNDKNVFNISHIGEFYAKLRKPDSFLKAIGILVKEKLIPKDRIKINFIGAGDYISSEQFKKLLDVESLKEIVNVIEYVSHRKSIQFMLDADALLLLQPSEKTNTQIPAKTFEYIYTGSCILAITPIWGATADVIKSSGHGVIAKDNIDDIKEAVCQLYQGFLNNSPKKSSLSKAHKYDRKFLTSELSKIFNEMREMKDRKVE